MQIRRATAADLDAVIDIGTRTWWGTYPPIAGGDYVRAGIARWWTPEAVLPAIRVGRVLVAERDGRVIAMASYSLLDPAEDAAMLWKLYVDPAVQGSGAGRALVDAVIAEIGTRRGVLRLTHLLGNDHAHAVYQHLGFRTTGRVGSPIEGGPEEVVMERPLRVATAG